jgi:ATP synthase protein I
MTDGPDPKRLDALEKRLKAAQKAQKPEVSEPSHISQAQAGWRMVTELVVGLLMGFGIGYGIDYMAGTMPVFMLIFTMFGFAAGVRTMMRTANEIQVQNMTDGVGKAPAGDEKKDG